MEKLKGRKIQIGMTVPWIGDDGVMRSRILKRKFTWDELDKAREYANKVYERYVSLYRRWPY